MPKSDRGGRRGLGGGNGKSIQYTEKGDIMSLGEGSDPKTTTEFRNNMMDTFKDFSEEYEGFSDILEKEMVVSIQGQAGVMAFWSDDGRFALNETYGKPDAMRKAYDASVASGFHPSRGNKSAETAVTAHELGHALTTLARRKAGIGFDEMARKVVTDAMRSAKTTSAVAFAGKISGYAKDSNAECIAEAVADVYCNGKSAKAESRYVYDALRKYLK